MDVIAWVVILLGMDSLSNSSLLSSQLLNNLSSSSTTSAGTQNENGTFQQLLSLMLISNLSSSGNSSSSSLTSMLSPLLLLLEQLQSQQVSSQLESSSGAAASTSGSGTKSASLTADENNANVSYPVNGVLTQGYTSTHNGLDFGVVTGTSVQSTISGKVIYAGWNNQGYGNLVIVQNGNVKTYYAHLSQVPVTVGQMVEKGDEIGLSGSTGNSTGPHVHYEVRVNNANVDPSTFDSSSY